MAEGALPNPPLTFEEPRSIKPVLDSSDKRRGFWLYQKYVKENGLERPLPAWTTDNLGQHPIWTMQVRQRCRQLYTEKTSLINACVNTIAEAHTEIRTQVQSIEALEKPIEFGRENIAKQFEKTAKEHAKLDKLRTDLEEFAAAKAEHETLVLSCGDALEKATAARAAADDAKTANAALVKEVAEELRHRKNAVAAAKKAKAGPDEMDAATDAEAAAKGKQAAAKAETKVIAARVKNTTKAFNDAKGDGKKAASNVDMFSKKVAQTKQYISQMEKKVADALKRFEKPKRVITSTFEKIANRRVTIEGNEALIAAKQEEIRAHITAVLAHIVESREAEVQYIFEQHKNVRDSLLATLDGNLLRIDAIEKHRAARVRIHGDEELNRRCEQIVRIKQLKQEENNRRDGVNRDCVLCGRAVGNKAAAEHHRKPPVYVSAYTKGGKYENDPWPGCPAYMAYYCAVYIEKTMKPNNDGPPGATFTTKEPVGHISTLPPMLDGSFWNSKLETIASKWKCDGQRTKDSVALHPFHFDVSMSPYSSHFWSHHGDFYDHQKLIKGGVARDTGNIDADGSKGSKNTGAQFYAMPWDPSMSQCSKPANPPCAKVIFEGGGKHVKREHEKCWERTYLQWNRPHVVNGKVGDRFTYLTMHHEWWDIVVREGLAELCECVGKDWHF